MSEDLVDRLLSDGRSWLGCASNVGRRWKPQRYFVKITGELELEAAIEILELRRELAMQWRDWDDVTELDAKLARLPPNDDTTPMTPNDDITPMPQYEDRPSWWDSVRASIRPLPPEWIEGLDGRPLFPPIEDDEPPPFNIE